MSDPTLHDYFDRAEQALARIEAALAKKARDEAIAPALQQADDSALRFEVARVVAELDSLIQSAEAR